MKIRILLVIVTIAACCAVFAEQSLAVKIVQRQRLWEDFIGFKNARNGEPFRIWVIKNHNSPCNSKTTFKYPVNYKKLTGTNAIQWMKKRGLVKVENGKKLKTETFRNWQDAKKLNSLYWQYCKKTQDNIDGFKGNCTPTESGKSDDPNKIKLENDYCPDHRWIEVWVDKSQAMGHWCQINRRGNYRQTHDCEKHCTCQGKRPTSDFEKIRVK